MKPRALIAVAVLLGALAAAQPAQAAVSVTKAELRSGQLRVEGRGAQPGSTVTVSSDSTATGRADGAGGFRIEASGFRSSTCRATVSDPVSSTTTTLSGCTATSPSAPPALQSVTFTPSTVAGGGGATGILTFDRATDGAAVALSSSNPAVVQVPSEAVVNQDQSRGAFPVSTSRVSATTTVTITASHLGGVTRTGTITVTAEAPPAADTARIVRAEWNCGRLRIEATSTNANAVLDVYLTASNSFMFTLTNLGGGRYADERGWVTRPGNITVRSNFGGSASADVNARC